MTSAFPLELARNIHPDVTANDITSLAGGYSSHAYMVKRGEESCVLLVEREGAVTAPHYGHAFVVLKLLESAGYVHAPRPIWLHPDKSAVAISYFAGQPSDTFDFRSSSVDPLTLSLRVTDAILDTATIARSEYEALCSEYGVVPTAIMTPADLASDIGTSWFAEVEESCPDADIVTWLRPRVARSVAYANDITPHDPVLGHGDPSSPNILISADGEFQLIDWDSSRFSTEGPEYYISYITHLTDFMRPYKNQVIAHAAERIGVSADAFSRRVFTYSRYYQVFDVNWAALMMAKVASGTVAGDMSKFRKIARERIARYETDFER